MRKLEGRAHGGAFWEFLASRGPSGFFGYEFLDACGTSGIKFRIFGFVFGIVDTGKIQDIETELDGVLPCRVSELVYKRLEHPGEGVAAGSAEGVSGNADGHERSTKEKVGEKRGRKLSAVDACGRSELLAFAEADEMVMPGDEIAGRIEAALEEVVAGGAVVVVMKVVFAGPEKFDGNAGFLGDGSGFHHVIVGETSAKTTAGAHHVDGDVRRGNVENLGDKLAAVFGSLRG